MFEKRGEKWPVVRLIRRPSRDPIIILPYLGYGTPQKLTVRGRVLEDEGFTATGDADSRWRNLVRFWKRLESDEVPGARSTRARGGGAAEAVTDREGYFRLSRHAGQGRLEPGRAATRRKPTGKSAGRRSRAFAESPLRRDQRH